MIAALFKDALCFVLLILQPSQFSSPDSFCKMQNGIESKMNGVEMQTNGLEPNRFYYFSYGSNMLSKRIRINNPSAIVYEPAKLEGYKLGFNYRSRTWNGAVATIDEDPSSHVWGVVWTMDVAHIPTLDAQEGVHQGIYKPINVTVTTMGGEVLHCRSYQQTQSWDMDRRPSVAYKNVILSGARENGVPKEYIRNVLEKIEDNGYEGPVEVKLDLTKKQ